MGTSTDERGHVYEARCVNRRQVLFVLIAVAALWLVAELLMVVAALRAGQPPAPGGMVALAVMAAIVGVAAWATTQALGRAQLFVTNGGLVYQRAGGALAISWDNVAAIEPAGPAGAPVLRLRAPRVARRSTPFAPAGDRIPLYLFDYRPGSPLQRDLQALAPRLFPGRARNYG